LARARAEALVAEYAASALRAFAEVESALAAEALLAAREQHLRTAADEASAAQVSAEDRYGRGLDELALLLDAQRRALTAASQVIAVRRERIDTRIDLHLALGGAFETPVAPVAGGGGH
jgi:outer membrane protein TolC